MMETKARMRAAVFGICVNLCLFMVKLYVGISTNSISIYVDSLNNALDSVEVSSRWWAFGFPCALRLSTRSG